MFLQGLSIELSTPAETTIGRICRMKYWGLPMISPKVDVIADTIVNMMMMNIETVKGEGDALRT